MLQSSLDLDPCLSERQNHNSYFSEYRLRFFLTLLKLTLFTYFQEKQIHTYQKLKKFKKKDSFQINPFHLIY